MGLYAVEPAQLEHELAAGGTAAADALESAAVCVQRCSVLNYQGGCL